MTILERGVKVRRINSLMSACRLIPNRTDLLGLWNVQSYDEMTDEELLQLQSFMEAAYRFKTTPASDAIRRLRSQVLSLLTKAGIYSTPDDWAKVNRYLLQRRICGRLLYMLDAQDLQALLRKLRAIGDKRPATTPKHSAAVPPIILFSDLKSDVVN